MIISKFPKSHLLVSISGDTIEGEHLYISSRMINDCNRHASSEPVLTADLMDGSNVLQINLHLSLTPNSYTFVSVGSPLPGSPLSLIAADENLRRRTLENFCQFPNNLAGSTDSFGFQPWKSTAAFPHQHDAKIRGRLMTEIYGNLDYQTCNWNYRANFSLALLFKKCGINQERYFMVSEREEQPLMKAAIPIWMHKIKYKAPQSRSPLDVPTLDDSFEVTITKAEIQLIFTYSASNRENKEGAGWFYGISSERQGDKDLYPGIHCD